MVSKTSETLIAQDIRSVKKPSGTIAIIGAGPAGLACADTLAGRGIRPLVIEKDDAVAGFCRTIDFKGYLFDIGGHRFLSRSEEINGLWKEILGPRLLRVKRISRIHYKNKYFDYPLSAVNTFRNLGMKDSLRSMASFLRAKWAKSSGEATFEDWIVRRFGKRLFKVFFDVYTRKVWGVPCRELSVDWADQRIKGLSFGTALREAIIKTRNGRPKTLAEEFFYPEKGPGEFYDLLHRRIVERGAEFLLNRTATAVRHDGRSIRSVAVENSREGGREEIPVDYLFSSMPLPAFIKSLIPAPGRKVIEAAERLRFRSIIVVNVIFDQEFLFPDQWIYVHSPEVKLARIQNFKNWSPAMIPDPQRTSLGLEYFCSEGDDLWKMDDERLIDQALREIENIGIVSRKRFLDGFVVRRADAYPFYSLDYRSHLRTVQDFLSGFSNFQAIGRAGLFRYGNSDLVMLSGIRAARNFTDQESFDVWDFGEEREYLER